LKQENKLQNISKQENKALKQSKSILKFQKKLSEDKVGIYTAQASFFIILSIFPFVLLLLNLISLTDIDKSFVINGINTYLPDSIKPLLVQMINELYSHVSGTVISITAMGAIWSASKGFLSVMFGIYNIYKPSKTRNYFVSRFISMIYTIFFLVAILLTMVFLVFGNKIFNFAISLIPALKNISILTLIVRYIFVFLALTFLFVIIFKIANFKNTTFIKVLPGATFSSLGWIIFSYAFSIYVDNFSNMTYMYGSLTAFIILMLWIYFCIYIFFIGLEINNFYFNNIKYDNVTINNSDSNKTLS
jgi:membrane protein